MRRENLLKTWCVACLIAAAWLGTNRAWGAYKDVYITISGFSPSSVSINVGDIVYFNVGDFNGPYGIQVGGLPPATLWDYEEYVGYQFNLKGDYSFREIIYGYTGVVHVGTGTPNVAPTVKIISPANGAVFTEPASFTFAASATDPDNGIWGVNFYVEPNLVDTVVTSPYSTQVTNLAAGDYTLSVTTYDNVGASASDSITIKVQSQPPPPITFGPPRLVAGQFQLEVGGLTVGKQAVLQASSSLGSNANWVPLQTVAVTASTMPFSQPATPGAQFFRVVQLP